MVPCWFCLGVTSCSCSPVVAAFCKWDGLRGLPSCCCWLSTGATTSRRLAWALFGRWVPKAAREKASTKVQAQASVFPTFAKVRRCEKVTGRQQGWEEGCGTPNSLEPFLSWSASPLSPGHPLLLTRSHKSRLVVLRM